MYRDEQEKQQCEKALVILTRKMDLITSSLLLERYIQQNGKLSAENWEKIQKILLRRARRQQDK